MTTPTYTHDTARELAATITAVLALAALLATATHYIHPTPPPQPTPNPSYPLQAHWEQINGTPTPVCDPQSATAWPDSLGGINITVHMPGPGTIDAWINGNAQNGHMPIHMVQQITRHGAGANFAARTGSPKSWIRITADNKRTIGTCSVLPGRR